MNLIPDFIAENYYKNKLNGNFYGYALFLDIKGFTSITEKLKDFGKEGIEILNTCLKTVFQPLIKEVKIHNGFISHFAGDAFNAFFIGDKNFDSLICADNIVQTMKNLKPVETKFGSFEFSVKIGISYGKILWGIAGSDDYLTYYFRGKPVDESADAESFANENEIIVKKGSYVIDDVFFSGNKTDREDSAKKTGIELSAELINQDFLRLSGFDFKEFPKEQNRFAAAKSSQIEKSTFQTKEKTKILKNFTKKEILNNYVKDEFRFTVNVFISLQNMSNHKEIKRKTDIIIQQTEKYGGYFESLSFGDKGTTCLIIFGIPKTFENNIDRALDLSYSLLQEFGNELKAGITAGTVFSGFKGSELRQVYGVLGDEINVSARIMSIARWGEIRITDRIFKKANMKYDFKFLDTFKLKGKKEEIPIFLLKGLKEFHRREKFSSRLIGREKELSEAELFLKPAENNKFAGIIYIDGIPGIGKSRLLYQIKQKTEDKFQWFYLPCDEVLKKSFNPINSFLKFFFNQREDNSEIENKKLFKNKIDELLNEINDSEIKNELNRTQSALGAFIDLYWKDSLYKRLDSKQKFENMISAFKNLIKGLSLNKPVVLEIEDIQWIDSASGSLLKSLTTNIENYPIVLAVSSRYLDDGSEFRLDLNNLTEKRIKLDYLSSERSKALIETILDSEIPAKTAELIFNKTEGNPLFIEQLILFLQENNLFDTEYNIIKEGFEIPSSISSIITARIDRLSNELKNIVQTASVLGREFNEKILREMINSLSLNMYLNEGEKEVIWSKLKKFIYSFTHALIHQTVYDMQLKRDLRKLHKKAAEIIEFLYKENYQTVCSELANHYEKAEIEDKAALYLEMSGDISKEKYENERALFFYNKLTSIDFIKSRPEKYIKILLKKSEILSIMGKWDDAVQICSEAEKISESENLTENLGSSAAALGNQFYLKSSFKEAEEKLSKALKIFRDIKKQEGIAKVLGKIGMVKSELGEYSEALSYFQEQLELSKKMKNVLEVSNAVGNIAHLYTEKGDYDEALKFYEEKYETSLSINNKSGMIDALRNKGSINLRRGKLDEALKNYEAAFPIAVEIGDILEQSNIIGNLGIAYWKLRDFDKALTYYQKHLKIAEEIGDKSGISRALGNLGILFKNKGDYKNGIKNFKKALKNFEELGHKLGASKAYGSIGLSYAEMGQYKEALKWYEKRLKIVEELDSKGGLCITKGNMGESYRFLGKYKKALECYRKAEELSKEIGLEVYLPVWLLGKSITYLMLEDYEKSKKSALQALEYSIETKNTVYQFDIELLILKIDLYSALEDIKSYEKEFEKRVPIKIEMKRDVVSLLRTCIELNKTHFKSDDTSEQGKEDEEGNYRIGKLLKRVTAHKSNFISFTKYISLLERLYLKTEDLEAVNNVLELFSIISSLEVHFFEEESKSQSSFIEYELVNFLYRLKLLSFKDWEKEIQELLKIHLDRSIETYSQLAAESSLAVYKERLSKLYQIRDDFKK